MSVSGVGGPRVPPSTRSESTQRATAAAPTATEQRATATGHSQASEFESSAPTRTQQKPLTDEELQQVDAWAKSLVDDSGYSPEAAGRMKAEVLKRMGEFVKNNPNATTEQLGEELKKSASGARAEEMFNQNWLNQMMSQIQQRAKEAMSSLFK
ncbi:hypothetical protein [Archangium sp.]|jgi:hypothetical protein|uniref:hypothetical protein n=1 Tax=Archangium sp. TaxID=1872627 RepID=UPI002ED84C67